MVRQTNKSGPVPEVAFGHTREAHYWSLGNCKVMLQTPAGGGQEDLVFPGYLAVSDQPLHYNHNTHSFKLPWFFYNRY